MRLMSIILAKSVLAARLHRYVLLILIFILFCHLLLTSNIFRPENFPFGRIRINSNPPVRGIIVTLTQSTNQSISRTINMINSVIYFHRNNGTYVYPFLIFHDKNFTAPMQQNILSCVLRTNKNVKILFAIAYLGISLTIHPGETIDTQKAYRLMCRFWTYDVFYHPAIVEGKYDYIMRMDDDSYFSDVIDHDIFSYVRDQELDYAYRTTYVERTPAMDRVLRQFVNSTVFDLHCIYSHFFVMRLKWFYESQLVQSFVRELVKNDLILQHHIGDGCVHAVMVVLEKKTKVELLVNIPYGHNAYISAQGTAGWVFYTIVEMDREIDKSCQQLTVISRAPGNLTQIKIS